MTKPVLFIGEAGTGKTTSLHEWVEREARHFVKEPWQRVLVLSYMHGARRRLESRFSGGVVPAEVLTLDHIALRIANRWRMSEGIEPPIVPSATSSAGPLGARRTFDDVVRMSCRLLESNTISRLVANDYPVVVVDEAQDLDFDRCEFLNRLSRRSALALAADPFQCLSDGSENCAVLEWLLPLARDEKATVIELTEFHRFESKALLHAANALRSGIAVTEDTIRVIACPNAGPLAAKVMWSILGDADAGYSYAMLTPAAGRFIDRVMFSFERQSSGRLQRPMKWQREESATTEAESLRRDCSRADGPRTAAGRLVLQRCSRVEQLRPHA